MTRITPCMKARNRRLKAHARAAREEAYRAETDPLVAQVLCGEASPEELSKARAAIKARHPYPKDD